MNQIVVSLQQRLPSDARSRSAAAASRHACRSIEHAGASSVALRQSRSEIMPAVVGCHKQIAPIAHSSCIRRQKNMLAGETKAAAAGDSRVESPSDGKVFLVGATGRIGGMVARKLAKSGVPVVAMVRDLNSEKAALLGEGLTETPIELVEGSLNSSQEELEAMLSGCTTCISCSGTERTTKLFDVFGGALDDPAHPYNVNYKGIETLCAAMTAQGCKKIVRITGSAIGKSPFYPFTVLLNSVLSMATKWQSYGEDAIRASGLQYTIIRPPALTDAPDGRPADAHLMLTDQAKAAKGGAIRISREDVAELIALAYNHPSCTKATLECKEESWEPLLSQVREDMGNLELNAYKPAMFVYYLIAATVLVGIAVALQALFRAIVASFL